jgi:hypothetical protein
MGDHVIMFIYDYFMWNHMEDHVILFPFDYFMWNHMGNHVVDKLQEVS